MNSENWQVVHRGKVGWCADAGRSERYAHHASSGGDLATYAEQAVYGALLYDAEQADYEAYAALVVTGPMLNLDLPARTFQPFFHDPEQLPDGIEINLKSLRAFEVGPLAYVSLDIYVELLRNVPGVRFGKIVHGKPVWDDESPVAVARETQRWQSRRLAKQTAKR